MSFTDSDLRGIVLSKFYEKRRENRVFSWDQNMVNELVLPEGCTADDIMRICDQLGEHGLINWTPTKDRRGATSNGFGKISAHGVDVIEGNAQSPISIHVAHLDQSTHYAISNSSNNQIGNGNVQGNGNVLSSNITVREIAEGIEKVSANPGEKAEATGLLQNLLRHPLVAAITGAAVSTALKS